MLGGGIHKSSFFFTLLFTVFLLFLSVVGAIDHEPQAGYERPGILERVSVAPDGNEADGGSSRPSITDDGRYVAFESFAENLVPNTTNWPNSDIFVHDRESGSMERVSVASNGSEGNGRSNEASLSADGRYVAFDSRASNLVPDDTNGVRDVFVHDRQTGETERVSIASNGTEGDGASLRSSISADGRYVAFDSQALNLVPDVPQFRQHIYLHDRETGETEMLSVASDGTVGSGNSARPSITADGRYVAYHSTSSNLVPDDTNNALDVFVHDRKTSQTERVSVSSDGNQGDGRSDRGSISADGRHVAFTSQATNLIPGDSNAATDVFVHDRETGETERVSVASDGTEGDQLSVGPTISADGRHVTFYGSASNLAPNTSSDNYDVFVHDRSTGTTDRASIATNGTEGDLSSVRATISADGRFVAFFSWATNLVRNDTNEEVDVFVRDRGPAIGLRGLAVEQGEDHLTATGWATLSGSTLNAAHDPPDDAATGDPGLGGDILGASILVRPIQEDLQFRIDLDSLPSPLVGGAPGVLYSWSFTLEDVEYEVRAMRAAATGLPAGAPYFALYECDPICIETQRLTGGIGSTGSEVWIAMPLDALGLGAGDRLETVEASAAVGEAASGTVVTLDQATLPDTTLPPAGVWVGIASPSTPEEEIDFSTPATLDEGRFTAELDTSSLEPGPYEVWAKACIAEDCGAESVQIDVP